MQFERSNGQNNVKISNIANKKKKCVESHNTNYDISFCSVINGPNSHKIFQVSVWPKSHIKSWLNFQIPRKSTYYTWTKLYFEQRKTKLWPCRTSLVWTNKWSLQKKHFKTKSTYLKNWTYVLTPTTHESNVIVWTFPSNKQFLLSVWTRSNLTNSANWVGITGRSKRLKLQFYSSNWF